MTTAMTQRQIVVVTQVHYRDLAEWINHLRGNLRLVSASHSRAAGLSFDVLLVLEGDFSEVTAHEAWLARELGVNHERT